MTSVSHSEVESYTLCKRKHYYGYGLGLERVSTSSSMAKGSAGHKILEEFYKVILAAGDTHAEQLAAWDDAIVAAEAAYKNLDNEGKLGETDDRAKMHDMLFKFYFPNEPMLKEGFRILAVEKEFNLEYSNDEQGNSLTYPFVIDLIVVSPSNETIVVDHKFVYDFYTSEASQLQPQIPKYIGGLRALGYKVSYGAYNMIRTRKIVGKKNAANPEGEGPTLDQAIQWLPVKPNVTRITRTFSDQIDVAQEVQALKALPIEEQERKAFRVANNMVCKSCSFKDLCTAELMGANTDVLMRAEYQKRARREFIDISEDA